MRFVLLDSNRDLPVVGIQKDGSQAVAIRFKAEDRQEFHVALACDNDCGFVEAQTLAKALRVAANHIEKKAHAEPEIA